VITRTRLYVRFRLGDELKIWIDPSKVRLAAFVAHREYMVSNKPCRTSHCSARPHRHRSHCQQLGCC
jgi:hypothetical protein